MEMITEKVDDDMGYEAINADNRVHEPSIWGELKSLGIKLVVTTAVVIITFTFFYGLQRNTDLSMFPMVKDGDLVLFYRLDKDYAIGDLLLLEFQGERQVRRVVAKAGDSVDISEHGLIVNGSLQQELGIYEKTYGYAEGIVFPVTVGSGEIFVLGDARQNATDSRVYGSVSAKDTYGKVITIIWRRNL